MYDFIQGDLVSKSPTVAVVEAGGVGYRIHIPLSTFESLPDRGRVRLLTHWYVREDQQRLYGFRSAEERDLFEMLLTVRGVGPAVALGVLSGISVQQFNRHVTDGRVEAIQRIRGVGRKTAERIVMELRDRIVAEAVPAGLVSSHQVRDAVTAMVSLGYSLDAARTRVTKAAAALGDGAPVEAVIREALRRA